MNINHHEDRVKLAAHTLAICESGHYTNSKNETVSIQAELLHCLEHTLHYTPETLDELRVQPDQQQHSQVEVTGETTMEAAARLVTGSNERVLALNFASAKNPGGGFLRGSVAQEESIARSSGLYPSLLKVPAYYSTHRNSRDLLYTDHMIYSPGVPVFRNDNGDLLDRPYLLSVVTSPATNKGAMIQNQQPGIERIEALMLVRAEKVLKIAVKHGYKKLVLGAWGCGVFQNDPALIAAIFHRLLCGEGPYSKAFSHIVFAVYDRTKEQTVITPFREIFSKN